MPTIKEFDYKDSKGKESFKYVLVIQEPTTLMSGYDIGELDNDQQGCLVDEFAKVRERYLAELTDLLNKYDLKNMYRQYKIESMSNIETEVY
jgi:hypothetical protein